MPLSSLNAVAQDGSTLFSKAVKSACESVIQAEPEITKYDTSTCDSDYIKTLCSLAVSIKQSPVMGTAGPVSKPAPKVST